MGIDISKLTEDVQFNCDVADANYAGNYTMCIYLLKMRELYRWSESIDQSSRLLGEAVSAWVEDKEGQWESLESEDFRQLEISGRQFDPFDVDAINDLLKQNDLVYGAGYGRGCRPEFYLAELKSVESYPSYDVMVSDQEYARDLAAPVAMSQGRTIYVRRESVRRMLWEQIEAWRWRKSPASEPLARALSYVPIDDASEAALDELTEVQLEYAINHEVGEIVSSEMLGEIWAKMLIDIAGTRVEFIARAIKDHLADALVTLPVILREEQSLAIHLYFSNLHSLRKLLFPQLELAYEQWVNGDKKTLISLLGDAHTHWLQQAEKLIDLYRQSGQNMQISDDELLRFQPVISLNP